jgi:hypothetical protein
VKINEHEGDVEISYNLSSLLWLDGGLLATSKTSQKFQKVADMI